MSEAGSSGPSDPSDLSDLSESSGGDAGGRLNLRGARLPAASREVDAASYNGVSIYDLDLDSLPSKPWRQVKNQRELEQYFNYGFDEATWRLYCEKVRQERQEQGSPSYGP